MPTNLPLMCQTTLTDTRCRTCDDGCSVRPSVRSREMPEKSSLFFVLFQ